MYRMADGAEETPPNEKATALLHGAVARFLFQGNPLYADCPLLFIVNEHLFFVNPYRVFLSNRRGRPYPYIRSHRRRHPR
jgi:hypothetical protein